jgi:hypothetical protein
MDRAELQQAELRIAAAVFCMFDNDALIDQVRLREWVCYKVGLDKTFVIKAQAVQPAAPVDLAQEPMPETPTGESFATPPVPAPEPEPAPAPEPEMASSYGG